MSYHSGTPPVPVVRAGRISLTLAWPFALKSCPSRCLKLAAMTGLYPVSSGILYQRQTLEHWDGRRDEAPTTAMLRSWVA